MQEYKDEEFFLAPGPAQPLAHEDRRRNMFQLCKEREDFSLALHPSPALMGLSWQENA